MGPKTRLLTHKERIILLLDEIEYDPDEYMAPYLLCQDGISDALDILKNNVSREISSLKEKGLVEEKLSRVKGMDRRRNIYLLTEKGKDSVGKILEDLDEEKILIEKDGRKRVEIGKAVDILKKDHPNVSSLHVEEWLRKKNILDIDKFEIPLYAKKEYKEEKVEMVVRAPVKGEFHGRKEEINKIISLLERSVPPIILISGIAGIGKSSLGIMLMDKLKSQKDSLWYSFYQWDNKDSLSKVLSDFCVRGGQSSLDTDKPLPAITTEFIENLSELDPIIFFDDCEKTSDELEVFFEIMLEHKKRGEDFSLVLMSRKKMDFYDIRDIMDDYIFELELGPIDIEAVSEMVGGEEDVESIYERTEGHPLYVELSKKYPGETTQINDFIENEIYSNLEDKEKEVLRKLSVFWEPVRKEILLGKGDSDVLIDLKKNNLIKETREGKITIHSILKDFFYGHLSIDKRKRLHSMAAERLRKIEGENKLETLYHFEKGERWEESLEIMKSLSTLIGSLSEPIRKEIIDGFPVEQLPETSKAEYYEILGNIYLESEEWERAHEYYEKAIEKGLDSTFIRERIGEAQMKLERWKETIESHEKALRKYQEKDDKEGILREYLSLGTVYRKKGDHDEAKKYYNTVKKMIEKTGITEVKPTLYNNMAMLALSKKDFKKAEEMFQKAMKLGGDKGVIYENLSSLYRDKGEKNKAINYTEKAIDSYLENEKNNPAINLLLDSADYYTDMGDIDKAISNLNKGLRIERNKQKGFSLFKKKKMGGLEVRLHDKLADILRNRDWKGCLNHRMSAVNGYSQLGEDEKSNRVMLKYAFDLHDSGRLKEALNSLDDIIYKLEKRGVMKGVNACELEKARIYREMGRYAYAEKVLDDIIERSEEIGDQKALEKADKMREKVLEKMGKKV